MRIKFLQFICFLFFAFGLIFMSAPIAVQAQSGNYGLDSAQSGTGLPKGEGSTASESLAKASGKIIGALLAFLGAVFLILVIYGGVLWMTSSGNDQQVAKARNLIIAAVIGLIIVLSAYAITSYIGTSISNTKT